MPVLLPGPDLFIDFASKPGIRTLFKKLHPLSLRQIGSSSGHQLIQHSLSASLSLA